MEIGLPSTWHDITLMPFELGQPFYRPRGWYQAAVCILLGLPALSLEDGNRSIQTSTVILRLSWGQKQNYPAERIVSCGSRDKREALDGGSGQPGLPSWSSAFFRKPGNNSFSFLVNSATPARKTTFHLWSTAAFYGEKLATCRWDSSGDLSSTLSRCSWRARKFADYELGLIFLSTHPAHSSAV